jgi:uncharacterized protein
MRAPRRQVTAGRVASAQPVIAMLVRLILVLLVLVAAFVAVRRVRGFLNQGGERRVRDARTVRCAHCDVYFPRDEAIEVDGQAYCSRAHAERHRA